MIASVRYVRTTFENDVEVDVFLYRDLSKCRVVGTTKRIVYPSILGMTNKDVLQDLMS